MSQPVILVVSEVGKVLEALTRDLRRRFGIDYSILGADSPTAALTTVAGLAARSQDVALVIADQNMVQMPAAELVARAHEQLRTAKRVLLIDRGDWSAAHPALAAMAVGQIDYHLYNPWSPLERNLYPNISEFLAAWDTTQEPSSVPLRIVGPQWSVRSQQIRDVLSRVGVPYWFYAEDSSAGRRLLREAGVDGSRLPVVVHFGGGVLVDPSHAELVSSLGVATRPNLDACDVAIIGAGPAGLAAAVYAASEGLRTLVIEPVVPGGQAGTSSLIRNYLGFQHGLSGADLAKRASEQAWLFGTHFVLGQAATALAVDGSDRLVSTTDGSKVAARAVVIATGGSWRRLGVPRLEALVGSGVFYGATGAEAQAMRGLDVYVVGAGNSAGQAALHLAKYAHQVTMLVRGDSLAVGMSEYLTTEIDKTPNADVRLHTEVVDGGGQSYLETLTLRTKDTDTTQLVPASALFVLIGAEPHTQWLPGSLDRDDHGFVRTGRDLLHGGQPPPGWPLARSPLLLETSIPGVFAAGDVRHRSVKRVASAVGEGAIAIQLVHEYLDETRSLTGRAPRS
jgi:thioredoxin reductase (NADPH)